MAKQLSLPMKKPRGRPALTAAQSAQRIRHRARPALPKGKPLHVTLKADRERLGTLRNKAAYKEIRQAMLRARLKGVRIVHYTVQGDHIHMLIEAQNIAELGRGMRAMSISLSKRLGRLAGKKIRVLKQRYHLHILKTLREVKHALQYIFTNSKKHGFTKNKTDWYSSQVIIIRKTASARLKSFVAEIRRCIDPPHFYLNRCVMPGR